MFNALTASGTGSHDVTGRRGKKVKEPLTFFMMTLALRLGKTLYELQRDLSASELLCWMAYDQGVRCRSSSGDYGR
ncbi:hypothetical protein [Xenorhabdus bovienii]|uniref:hypothetical protein n=1 Tax=Xenorhabdus bovienii TaxID=40576 RepID=UPI000A51512D|nr:hypothetical protein [Xenorhabdus bovienii]